MKAIDRSQVLVEAYPGAANELATIVEELGGYVCEQHPWLKWPHDDCPGPGRFRNERVS